MKRSHYLFAVAVLAFSVTACSNKKEASNVEPSNNPDATVTEAPITPTIEPTLPVENPTTEPTSTIEPTKEAEITVEPTKEPELTTEPTKTPSVPSSTPNPTSAPTATPKPTKAPTVTPTPTKDPTVTPKPTKVPTKPPKPTKAPTPTVAPTPEVQKQSLTDMMDSLLEGIDELPMVSNIEINEDNFSYYLFIDSIKGAEALASDAMIRVTPHSVVLLRVPEGADVESIAKDIKANANPAKWICTGAEKTSVTYKDDVILLVMSSEELVDAIVANFNEL